MDDFVFGRLDAVRTWEALASASVNYSADEVRRPEWHIDTYRVPLPAEGTGAPEPAGSWAHACRLVRDYEFSPPEIVRALYDPAAPLLGRNMLLEARFHGMHFYCGVRVTEVVDLARDDAERAWGFAYETLEGHLERGKVTYEVVKQQETGAVHFVISCHSQADPGLDRVTLLGWRVFGRRTQLRFYRRCGTRLQHFVDAALRRESPLDGRAPHVGRLVCAPSDARLRRSDVLAIHRVSPGGFAAPAR